MFSPLTLAVKYIKYYFTASNGRGHGIHSPFVFDFVKHVLNDGRTYDHFITVANTRKKLLSDRRVLKVQDFGAGSTSLKNNTRSVSGIAKTSLKPAKYGKLFFRIAKYYEAKHVLELGTSLGVTTSYLSKAVETVHTIEGSPEIAAVAEECFQKLHLNNIRLHLGTFEQLLQPVLQSMARVDLAFVDGNHRYKPTLEYFEQIKQFVHEGSILIFDDIHWSGEMEGAWEEIKKDEAVTLTIDLFFIGLVFFRKDFKQRQHFTIRF